VNDTTAIFIILILLNLGVGGILIRLRWIDKAIEHLPHIIKIQFEGQQRYIELLEARLRHQKEDIKA
jgi:hypothetical protein